jgi:hypothetical protein
MASIQNADVKGIPELDLLGLPYSKLIHDTKIWITAEGINRTLHDAILDRAIGLKGTAGAQIKNRSIFTQDAPAPIGTPIGAGFDGTALLRSDDEEFTFGSSFGIMGWVYLTDKSSDMILVNRWGDFGSQQYRIKYNSTDDRFEFETNLADNTQQTVFDSTSPALNTWYFISCVHERSVGNSISVNDGTVSSINFTLPLQSSAVPPLYLGGGNGVQAEALQGILDSWTFLDRVPTPAEITELYNGGAGKSYEILSVPLKQDVIGHFDLDEGDGQTRISKGRRSYTAINFELTVGGEVSAASGLAQPYQDDNFDVLGAFINGEGNTEIAVPWGFRNDSLIYVRIGLLQWTEYVSDEVTPDHWFRKNPVDGTIEFDGDIIASDDPIVIVSLEGVPPPSAAIALVEGLEPLHESYGNTTNLSQSTGVSAVNVVDGKTQIEFNFEIDSQNLQVLYVENKFWPKYKPDVTTEKYFKQIDVNTIELDQDYSFFGYKFYFAEFFEKGIVDDFGNTIIPMTPTFRTFGVASPNLTTWAIGVNDDGNIVTNDLYDIIPEEIRFRRDDGVICSIDVDINGDLEVNDAPVGNGILFDNMWFLSPNGSIFKIGIANDNKLYTEDEDGQKFCIKDKAGNEIYSIKKYPRGATMAKVYYPEGAQPPVGVIDDTNETLFAFIEVNGVPALHFYNPIQQRWELSEISRGGQFAIGETLESVLEPSDFREEYGPWWFALDGSESLDASLYPEFLELAPESWYDSTNDRIVLPDYTRYKIDAQKTISSQNVRYDPLEGYSVNDIWADISSIRRIYYTGIVDASDTVVNDLRYDGDQFFQDVRNTEQRAAGLGQILTLYRKEITKLYIKVK